MSVPAERAPGQGTTIAGTVFDSVAMRPLAAAHVQLVSAANPALARTVDTDSLGRFAFEPVPAGTWLVGFFHPRADSLLLQPPVLQVIVRDPGTVDVPLALPSARTLVARVCRVELGADSLGLLVGQVRDARDGRPRSGVQVRAQWRELTLRQTGLHESTETTEATSLDDGRFAMCGMPAGVTVMMVAGAGADSTGSFDYAFPAAGYAVRDLVVGQAERRRSLVRDSSAAGPPVDVQVEQLRGGGRVRGRVLRADGTPVVGASVRAWRGGAEARSASDGSFVLDSIPTGTQTIDARLIGFLPERRAVDVGATDAISADFTLEELARVSLDTVRVIGQRVYTSPRSAARFEERRKRAAVGYFLGEEEITRKDPLKVSDLLRQMPGVMVTPNPRGSGYSVTMSGGEGISTGRCNPGIWLDGAQVFGGMDLDSFVSGSEVVAMEVYTRAVQVPAEFQRMTGCGVIVVWTGMREARRR